LGSDFLAVHLERAGAGLPDAAEVVERQGRPMRIRNPDCSAVTIQR
jgi:hypothetical protein